MQVLNGFTLVASRKLRMNYAEIRDALGFVHAILPLTLDTHELGLTIAERFGFSFYDSMIVSSALESGCDVLYFKDLQQGQKIDGRLLVVNPFLDWSSA